MGTNGKRPWPVPGRHPGGRTCSGALPVALLMTALTLLRHTREIPSLWRETGR